MSAPLSAERPAEWQLYKRVGEIEARPWSAEDEYNFVRGDTGRISISPADRETGKVHGLHGGYVARNRANAEDQWYIAAEYFAKNYALSQPSPQPAGDIECPTCGSIDQADSGRCRDKFHQSVIDLLNAQPAPAAAAQGGDISDERLATLIDEADMECDNAQYQPPQWQKWPAEHLAILRELQRRRVR